MATWYHLSTPLPLKLAPVTLVFPSCLKLLQPKQSVAQASTRSHWPKNHGNSHGKSPKCSHSQAVPQENHQNDHTYGGIQALAPHVSECFRTSKGAIYALWNTSCCVNKIGHLHCKHVQTGQISSSNWTGIGYIIFGKNCLSASESAAQCSSPAYWRSHRNWWGSLDLLGSYAQVHRWPHRDKTSFPKIWEIEEVNKWPHSTRVTSKRR